MENIIVVIMKNIFLIVLSSFLFLSCTDNTETVLNKDTDWKNFKLKGEVKSFKEIKFLAVDNFSVINGGEKVRHIYNKEVLFNLDGNKIEENDYIPDGTLANRTVYLYKQNQLMEYNNYDSQGMLFGTGKYQTNDDGKVIRLDYKTNDGRYNWSESYQYDKNGNITEIKQFKTEEVFDTKELYAYNEHGKIAESEFHKDGKLVSKNQYNYDKEGNFDRLNFGDSATYTYKYNYDEKGNWTKKIVFENNEPSGILVREIAYFN
jgi:hypothetical protein